MWMGRAQLREQDTCTFDLHVFFAFSLFSKDAHLALCLFGLVFLSCDLLLAFIFLVFCVFFRVETCDSEKNEDWCFVEIQVANYPSITLQSTLTKLKPIVKAPWHLQRSRGMGLMVQRFLSPSYLQLRYELCRQHFYITFWPV